MNEIEQVYINFPAFATYLPTFTELHILEGEGEGGLRTSRQSDLLFDKNLMQPQILSCYPCRLHDG